ncbi:ELWxxDGT repeat protein [Hyalangium gracile]|uniref:ELWxxDGT repeat protein n=1 Tax=Hyalangium gracile TaxID=394092 RepID=UPI001CCDD1CB|nr:ELWxxDGT repeat protein [Hyalangium gracile]
MKRKNPLSAMIVAGAMAGLSGCSQSPAQEAESLVAASRRMDAPLPTTVQGPALLKDIHTRPVGFPELGWSSAMARTLPSGWTLATLEDELTGQELWITDGTAAGTTLLKELAPGPWSSAAKGYTAFNGAIYFGAEIEFGLSALMKTDGTTAGTVVVKSISNLEEPDDEAFSSMVSAGGALYFQHHESIWKSDGTEAGTVSLRNLLPSTVDFFDSGLVPLGSSVYFVFEDSAQGAVLWKTDGTAAGTQLVKDLHPDANGGVAGALVRVGQEIYFAAGEFNRELWKTDGTAAGTVMVGNSFNGSVSQLTAVGNRLFFQGGPNLWRTDGTQASTLQLLTRTPSSMRAVGGTLFFSAQDNEGRELWKSDGTVTGTSRVKDLFPGSESGNPGLLGELNGRLLLLAAPGEGRTGLWSSDGTDAGTVLLAERPEAWSAFFSTKPVVSLGTTALVEMPDSNGGKLATFRTDGTAAGTTELGSVRTGTKGSQVTALQLGVAGNKVFFQAEEENGHAVWASDGTPAGTVRLRGGFTAQVDDARGVGSTFFFVAADDTHGYELWKSDGTPGGTALVKDIGPGDANGSPSSMMDLGGTLYFSADDGTNGRELWKSDGTETGTVMVRDLVPGGSDSYPQELVAFNGALYFSASDADFNEALWKSDGTSAGTVKVTDADVEQLLVGGNSLYFMANETAEGEGLWKSDGTAAGTVLVRNGLDEVFNPVWANGRLYFMAYDATHGFEPWVSDGTEAGTRVLKDIAAGSQPSFGVGFTPMGNQVLFTARDDAHGFELWRTDGTEAGTQRVADLWPGPRSGIRINPSDDEFNAPFEVVTLSDRGMAVFAGMEETGGVELWVMDGQGGPYRYGDLAPGAVSSSPTGFVVVGGQLFFHAGDAASGREPRAVPLPTRAEVDKTPPTVTCPSNVTAITFDAQGTNVEYPAATASDASGAVTLTYSHPSGTLFATGETQVTVRATDVSGNAAQCSFTVTVRLETDESGDDEGCGCSSPGAGAGMGWGLLLLGLASLRPGRRSATK